MFFVKSGRTSVNLTKTKLILPDKGFIIIICGKVFTRLNALADVPVHRVFY